MRQQGETKMSVTPIRQTGNESMNAADKQKALDAALSQIEKTPSAKARS
jgi:exosome complex RNA-binding protein Rrp42 (RNase PH superfamily)